MTKIPNHAVDKELVAADIWDDEWEASYWQDYWDGVHDGEMSWQWYMEVAIRKPEGWRYVVIDKAYKDIMVVNWIKENYPDCNFKHEHNHFLIEQQEVAVIVALKWT